MADEQTGTESAVNALFSGASADPAPTTGSAPNAPQDATGALPGASAPSEDETWRPGFVPKAFRNAEGAWNGDQDAVFKSWYDGRQHVSALEAQLAEVKRAQSELVPETAAQYVDTFDFASLKEVAPNLAGGADAESNPIVTDLLKLGHAHGVPVAKMQAVVAEYAKGLNEHLPEQVDPAERRKQAKAWLGPNGEQIAADVQAGLAARARVMPFSKEKMDVLEAMVESGPGLALLHDFLRTGPQAPPTGVTATLQDSEQEKRDAYKALGTMDEAAWRANKDAIIARWLRANPDKVA